LRPLNYTSINTVALSKTKNFTRDSSPFKRAVHTAEIIADRYNYNEEIIKDNSLAPGSTMNAIIQLAGLLTGERRAFVGHQPDIGFQVSSLISNSEVNMKISPASIISISFDGNPKVGKGILKFLLPPVDIISTVDDSIN